MTSFVERKVNDICGRWLDGFTKDNVDISLLEAKITLSDLHFKTDELCLLSPTFAPSFFYVGKLSIDIPLTFNFSKPVKVAVSDVLAVVTVGGHQTMTPEDIRKSISANVHVKAILCKLASELAGGVEDDGGPPSRSIHLHTVEATHKVIQKLEVTVKGAHIRFEEEAREGLDATAASSASPSPSPELPVALGVCLSEISLGLDTRARETTDGGGAKGKRWFGHKFRKMEVALLGNFSRYNALDEASARKEAAVAGEKKQEQVDEASPAPTLAITKFASVRGLSAYFCRDAECYSRSDRQETLRRLKQGLRTPPLQLPPLLKRCRLGLGVTVSLSAEEWGRIQSMDIRLLAGDLHVQLVDDQLGHLLRWASLWDGHMRKLAQSALRPSRPLVHPTRPTAAAAADTEDTTEEMTKDTTEDNTGEVIEGNTECVIEDSTESVIEDSTEDSAKDSAKGGAEVTTSAEEPIEDITAGAIEDSAEDRPKDSAEEPIEDITTDAIENSAEDRTKNSAEESKTDSTKDSTEVTAKDSAEEPVEGRTEGVMEDSPEDRTEDRTEVTTDGNSEEPITDTPPGVIEDSAEDSTKDSTEGDTKDSIEDSIEDSTKDSAKDNIEVTTKDSTKDSTEVTTKDSTEVTTKDSTKDSTEVTTKDITEGLIKDVAEDIANDSSEEATKDTITQELPKDSTKELTEDIMTEDVAAVTTKENTEGVAEDSTGDVAEDTGLSGSSRYYRALWKHAGSIVLRDLRSSVKQRGDRTMHRTASTQAARGESREAPLTAEESEYRIARGLLWRTWFREWLAAARYLSVRQLLHPRIEVGTFEDNSGGTHSRLHEHLDLGSEGEMDAKGGAEAKALVGGVDATVSSPKSETNQQNMAKYLMPWQLPREDVLAAWSLVERMTLRWELRQSGGVKVALDEETADSKQLSPTLLQALWSIELQLEAELPHRICAIARQMAARKVARRRTSDKLWHARAEKQRRLGLGNGDLLSLSAPSHHGLARSISTPVSSSESRVSSSAGLFDAEAEGGLGGGDGADRVGTLLVRLGQLHGVGVVGVLSLAPKAVATLMLEESSASIEEMKMETNSTKVATYDCSNDRCCWDETFRLQVELDERYVQDHRSEKVRKQHRLSRSGSSFDAKGEKSTAAAVINTMNHRRTDSLDSTWSQASEAVPSSSFLLAVSCVDKRAFGETTLGATTLPGKSLTAVPLKVLEHRCALFSPRASGRRPRELTLETIFVPPGEDVALAEQELCAMGKRRQHQEKLEAVNESKPQRRSKPVRTRMSFGGRDKKKAGSSASGKPTKPQRHSLDNVGDHEVKVLSLAAWDSSAAAAEGKSSDQAEQAGDQLSPNPQAKPPRSPQEIPVVNITVPGKMALSARVAGVKVVVYLNSAAALARAGVGQGGFSEPGELVILFETCVKEIESCLEIDFAQWKIGSIVEAATAEFLDNGVFNGTKGVSSASGRGNEKQTRRPQLLTVGPVRVEAGATYLTVGHVGHGQGPSSEGSNDGSLSGSGSGTSSGREGSGEGPLEAPACPRLGIQESTRQGGSSRYTHTTYGDQRGWVRGVLSSSPMWDWGGRVKVGAFTAELGTWRNLPAAEEVWSHFRFATRDDAFKTAIGDTQVLCRGTADKHGAAESSTWLLRAGQTALALGVQIPAHERSDIPHAPSPTSYVCVSSSDSDSDNDSDSGSPTYYSQPDFGGQQGQHSPGTSRSRGTSAASSNFPRDAARASWKGAPSDGNMATSKAKPQRMKELPVLKDAASFQSLAGLPVPDKADMVVDGQESAKNAELVSRIQELEEEVAALRAAAAAAAAATAAVTVAATNTTEVDTGYI